MPVQESTDRDPAPDREATKAEHRKHAEDVMERPEHKVRPAGDPDKFDSPKEP